MIRRVAAVAMVVLVLTGCDFQGMESVPLPGGKGTGGDAIKVTVELPDVGTLTPNSQVKVNDIAVGTVTSLKAVDWHAEAKVSLESDVELPADAVARVGVNSLLGASYVELATPEGGGSGRLTSGATIPLSRGEAYPATEQVLSAASVVLNGGGLEQIKTITGELDKALGGNDHAIRDLMPRMASFVGALNAQKADIISTIEHVDALSKRFARNRGTLTRAVDELAPALKTLSDERPKLTRALAALRRLGDVATPVVAEARTHLVAELRDIVPALEAISRAGDSVVKGLGFAVTFPFSPETASRSCGSDYCNLFAVLDLTSDALARGFTTPGGSPALPGLPGLPGLPTIPGLPKLPGLTSATESEALLQQLLLPGLLGGTTTP
jgi:phospholipid/cholesterol/gamma-HCH transport system substrate-binding protein